MISINHKLRPTKKQENILDEYLWHSIGIENWVISQIKQELDENGFPLRFMKPKQIRSILSKKIKGHAKKSGIPSRLINDCIAAVCSSINLIHKKSNGNFKKINTGIFKLKFKAARKKKSFFFGGDIKLDKKGRLKIPGMKTTLRFSEMGKFHKLKKATLIRKFDSWYVCCVYDEKRKPISVISAHEVGIDPGLKTSLVLSDGSEYHFPKFYREGQAATAKLARKSKTSKKLKAKQAKIKNKRNDHHHKLSHELASKYSYIAWSNDNFSQMKQLLKFGKSYSDVSLGAFRTKLESKLASRNDGLGVFVLVDNKYSTQICSACGALSFKNSTAQAANRLEVRNWTCIECGSQHDRDVNAAINTLVSGRGAASDLGNHRSREVQSVCV